MSFQQSGQGCFSNNRGRDAFPAIGAGMPLLQGAAGVKMTTEIGLTPILVGIAGGSGSGKTTLTTAIYERLGNQHSLVMSCDGYYKDLSHLSPEARAATNFDHPDALDIETLTRDLHQLKAGYPIEVPIYDFTTHTRVPDTRLVHPALIVLIEGILLFAIEGVRSLLDLRVFVDAPADIRFIRRMARDIAERGRTVDSVIRQYLSTTRPMHNAFVEPSKGVADMVVSGEEKIERLTACLLERIQALTSCCP